MRFGIWGLWRLDGQAAPVVGHVVPLRGLLQSWTVNARFQQNIAVSQDHSYSFDLWVVLMLWLSCVDAKGVTVESGFTSSRVVLQGKKQQTRTSVEEAGEGRFSQQEETPNCWDSVTLLLSCTDFLLCFWDTLESNEHPYDGETCKNTDSFDTAFQFAALRLWNALRLCHFYSSLTRHDERGHDSDSQRRRFVDESLG